MQSNMQEFDDTSLEAKLKENGEIITSSKGVSMYPMLRNRKDMVVIGTPQGELKIGDVPLCRNSYGKLVLHRIIKIENGRYITRGDNQISIEKVKPEQIFGILKGFYRNGRYFDCKTSRIYKTYVFLNKISYPIRFVCRKISIARRKAKK